MIRPFLTVVILMGASLQADDLRHLVDNHEEEIRMLEEKFQSHEQIFESLQKKLREEKRPDNSADISRMEKRLEASMKGITADIHNLQKHANDSSKALNHFKDKIDVLEKQLAVERENNKDLQKAMVSLLEALDIPVAMSGKTYKVKSGDSLGKIALQNKTSVKEIKRVNGLTSDVIIPGQELKIP